MNKTIIDQFEKLVQQIEYDYTHATPKDKMKHKFRLQNVKKSLIVLKKYPEEIKEGKQLKGVEGIGDHSIKRIDEILKTGKLKEVKLKTKDESFVKSLEELQSIIGIGNKLATELITEHNIKSISELKNAVKKGKITLSPEVALGLRYLGIIKQDIPRFEMDMINEYLQKQIKKVDDKLFGIVCGSYRRKKEKTSDIDLLITHPSIETKEELESFETNYLKLLVDKLSDSGFLLDSLTPNFTSKYMGFCKFPSSSNKYPVRRIDIKYVPYKSYPASLLHLTGSGPFNNNMRKIAKKQGYKLNEYGLYKVVIENNETKYKRVKVSSEEDIFKKLNMDYVAPENRI